MSKSYNNFVSILCIVNLLLINTYFTYAFCACIWTGSKYKALFYFLTLKLINIMFKLAIKHKHIITPRFLIVKILWGFLPFSLYFFWYSKFVKFTC